jgi:hypothetical protein
MMLNPTLGFYYHEDFQQVGVTGAPWLIVGTNGTFAGLAGNSYGVAQLRCPGTANDECYVTSCNGVAGMIKADAVSNWWFEARVRIGQITAAQGLFCGLAGEAAVAADFMTDTTMALKVIDWLGFQVIQPTDVAPIWQTVQCVAAGSRVALSATAATGSLSFMKLGMKSVLGAVTFYVDGVALATGTTSASAQFPLNKWMQLTFANKRLAAVANTFDIDWVSAAQLR